MGKDKTNEVSLNIVVHEINVLELFYIISTKLK